MSKFKIVIELTGIYSLEDAKKILNSLDFTYLDHLAEELNAEVVETIKHASVFQCLEAPKSGEGEFNEN